MRVVLDRQLCDSSLSFCQRCSAALFRNPEGVDRPCIRDIIDDGKETLTIELYSDDHQLEIELTDEQREWAAVEGWEVLVNFDPALFRSGANERWLALRNMPTTH